MGMTKAELGAYLAKARTDHFFDDFNNYEDTASVTGAFWTKFNTSAGGESITNPDGDGGILSLVTGGTQNNAVGIASAKKLMTPTNGKALIGQCELNYTDAHNNDCAIFFGFSDTFSATVPLADTTFAPPASGTLIGWLKEAGDATWRVIVQIGSAQFFQQSTVPCQGIAAGANQRLVVYAAELNGYMEGSFWGGPQGLLGTGVNTMAGQLDGGERPAVYNSLGTGFLPGRQIKGTISNTSAAAMKFGIVVKAGGANSQTVSLDYMAFDYLARP